MLSYIKKIKREIQWSKSRVVDIAPALGWIQAYIYTFQEYRLRDDAIRVNYSLFSKHSKFPLTCRPNTSDIKVFSQIFIDREYSCLDEIVNVDYIVDCGANVGYSSAYFLGRFPQAKVICIEPDPDNFAILEKNMAPYKDRVKLICSGLWSHPTGLKFSEETYRDGAAWSVQVRECRSDEIPEMQAIDIGSLLKELGCQKISILKMDIEGAEAIVFSSNYESWLPCVDNMVIELHDDTYFGKASDIVFNAIKSFGNKNFEISTCGELTVFKS